MTYKIYIGIDTGTHTGFAVWSKPEKKLLEVSTLMIHKALDRVLEYQLQYGNDMFVRFEDARLRKWLGDKTADSLQGAGSIKRDCSIWDDFLTDKKIPFASMAPRRGLTKIDPERFRIMTGWTGKTSNHARDAVMLVFGI